MQQDREEARSARQERQAKQAEKERQKLEARHEEERKRAAQQAEDARARHKEQQQKAEKQRQKEDRRSKFVKYPQQNPHQKCSTQTTARATKPHKTVSEGMAEHSTKWNCWVASLPRPDVATSAPFPHPRLFTKYLTMKAGGLQADADAAYKALMRTWHPDKFHQAIGEHLTTEQQDQLYPHVAEMAKEINVVFRK